MGDNQRQMQQLCHRYYRRFLHAGGQCAEIEESEVSQLHSSLQQSTRAVYDTAFKLREAGNRLEEARSVERDMAATQQLFARVLEPLRLMRKAEMQMERGQLLNAVNTLHLVQQAAAPLFETPMGRFLLREQVPGVLDSIVYQSLQQVNRWCKVLRESAKAIGSAALQHRSVAAVSAASMVELTAEGKWRLRRETKVDAGAELLSGIEGGGALGTVVEQLSHVTEGAGLQDLLTRCNQGDAFLSNVRESRDRQLQLEIENRRMPFEDFCATVLGFMVVEDVAFHITSPPVTSEPRLHAQWLRIVNEIGARAMQSSTQPSEVIKATLNTTRRFIEASTETVRAVELNPSPLLAAVEKLRSVLHTDLLQSLTEKLSEMCLSDGFSPLLVGSEPDYVNNVQRLSLHRAPHLLRAPVQYGGPASASQYLPYATLVPAVGFALTDFVEECYSVVKSSGRSELNNIDPMVLGYLQILTRTVGDMLNMRLQTLGNVVFHYAVVASSMNALLVVLSAVEQRFVTNWEGTLNGDQVFGEPLLLESSAKQFRKIGQAAIEKCSESIMVHVRQLLQPGVDAKYWANLPDADVSGVGSACDYLVTTLPQLAVVWTPQLVHSLAMGVLLQMGEVMRDVLNTAVRDGSVRDVDVLHKCINAFQERADRAMGPDFITQLTTVIAGSTQTQETGLTLKLSFDANAACSEHRHWVDNVLQVRLAEEAADQLRIAADLEAAGAAVVSGVVNAGKATKKGIFTFGRSVTKLKKGKGDAAATGKESPPPDVGT